MKTTKYYLSFKIDDENYLIINTLTGAIDIVDKNIKTYLDDPSNNNINKSFIVQLKERGYIVSDDDDINRLQKLLEYRLKKNQNGVFIICPTYLCNLRCKYCYEDLEVRNQKKVLNQKEVDAIFYAIKTICTKRNIKNISILLYGGEPFLPSTKAIVSYIFEKTVKERYLIRAITNGTNLYEFRNEFLKYKNYIKNMQITLDGDKNIHDKLRVKIDNSGTFDEIISNLDMIINMGIPVSLRVNTGKDNVETLPKILSIIEKHHWNKSDKFSCQFAPVTDHFCTQSLSNWMPENELLFKIFEQFDDFETIRKKYKVSLGTDMEKRTNLLRSIWINNIHKNQKVPNPNPCGAAMRSYYIFGTDGNIYACPETIGNTKFSIGRFMPKFEIYEKEENIWNRNIANVKKCTECNIAPICGMGCVWSSIATNGKNFDNPQCNYAHETIENFFNINKSRILKMIKDM